jgi:predicted NBD/HSP70 family sugar kinase
MLRTVTQRSYSFRAAEGSTRIIQATLGNEAGLFGAAYLPWVEPRVAPTSPGA